MKSCKSHIINLYYLNITLFLHNVIQLKMKEKKENASSSTVKLRGRQILHINNFKMSMCLNLNVMKFLLKMHSA